MNPLNNNPRAQTGISMIEVLVTLIIMLIGLLGLAGLMVSSQRSEMESYQRVQAIILLEDMAERINANRMAAMAPLPATGNCYNFTTNSATGSPYLGTGAIAATTAATQCTPASIAASYNLSATAPYSPTAAGTAFPIPLTTTPAPASPSLASCSAVSTSCITLNTFTNPNTNNNVATNPAATAVADLQAWSYALQGAAETSGGASAGAMVGARGCVSYDTTSELKALDGITTIYGSGVYTVSIAWQGLGDTFAPPLSPIPALNCGTGLYKDINGNAKETLRRIVSLTFRIGGITNVN